MTCQSCGTELMLVPSEWPWEISYWICPECDLIDDYDEEEKEDE